MRETERENRAGEPTVVTIVFPGDLARTVAGAVERRAAEAHEPVDVRVVDWSDEPAVRRAKARGTRSASWVRSHERPMTPAQLEGVSAAEVLVAVELPLDAVALARRLRFVQSVAAGVAPLVGALRGSTVPLCSAAGLSGEKVAEFVMARLLGVWLHLRRMDELQRSRRWDPDEVQADELGGRRVLIVGTGGIGQALARRAAVFGLRCVGVRRRPELGAPPGFDRVVGPEDLAEEIAEADAVVLAAPATPRTVRLIGAAELARCKPDAVLCNVARGSLVDEGAVADALTSGRLGAAVLDVTSTEPLSRRSPLWRAPGAYISPHVANDWTPQYLERLGGLVVENLVRSRRTEPLRNRVDLEEGY